MSLITIRSAVAFDCVCPRLFLIWLVSGLFLFSSLLGQEVKNGSTASADSVSEDAWNDETVYAIELIRLERWIRENTERFLDPILLNEIAVLKKEAEEFAEAQDFAMAILWLETVWDLLEPEKLSNGESHQNGAGTKTELDRLFSSSSAKKFRWTRELMSGVDLWRQQFQFAFIQEDSTFVESSGNPFTGIRLSFDYQTGSGHSLSGYTTFKYSRDYLTGEASIGLRSSLAGSSDLRLRNRFEGNSFYGDFELKYFQNVSEVGFSFRDIGPLSVDLEEEFLVRRYEGENVVNPNYFNNALAGRLRVSTGLVSYVGVGYENVYRAHPTHDEYDYYEHRFDALWYQSLGNRISFSVEDELRYRNYRSVLLKDILQDHSENYLRAELQLSFTTTFGTQVQGSWTRRDYQFLNASSLPDYDLWVIEPELFVRVGSEWRLSGGFYYSKQKYEDLSRRVLAQAVDADLSIPFDNNVTYGPTVSLEFFRFNGVMFSLQDTFHLQRYPDTRTDNLLRSNPYSDRSVHSILLFLTWNVSQAWRFNVLANLDDDRSRHSDSGDFQNAIVGIEIDYAF